jgi:hypothetical protein
MLLVNVEGKLIENIVIIGKELLFSDLDEETNEAIYSNVPVNEYEENTDYFYKVQSYLYDEDYLDFNNEQALESFKDECLKQHSKGNDSFKFKGLSISLDEIEDIPINRK